MKSNVEIARHPLHPMLVLIPVGAWIASLVLDIVFIATGNSFWFAAALWTIVIGIVGALIAAIAGMWDYFTLPLGEEPRRVGLTHMLLNLVIVALYIINVAAIRAPTMESAAVAGVVGSGIAGWALGLNVVAVALLLVSGWLGGELIYRYAVAIPRETMEQAPNYEARRASYRGVAGTLGGEAPPEEE